MEEWRTINKFPDYEASNYGNIRNKNTERVLRPGVNTNGYYAVVLRKDGRSTTKTVHRLVAETFHGEHDGMVIDHIDDNKLNNHISNLEFCSSGENNRRAYSSGLKKPSPCYDMPQNRPVRVIETGEVFKSVAECARSIGANRNHISDCLNGRLNKHHGYHYEEVNIEVITCE